MIAERNSRNNIDEKWMKLMRIGCRLGCHQFPHRSFYYKGYQFPVCARCTGVIISSIIATVVFFIHPISIISSVLLAFVMFVDWFIQHIGIKESNNKRRLMTGLIGGYGVMTIQMYCYRWAFSHLLLLLIK